MKSFSPRWDTLYMTLLLAGCSSPPEPVAVKWGRPATAMNSTLPQWKENNSVVRAPGRQGEWSMTLRDFQGASGRHGPDVYYAIAHASRIVVASNNSTAWFNTRDWLKAQGAAVPVEFIRKPGCLSCTTVDVSLSRLQEVENNMSLPATKLTTLKDSTSNEKIKASQETKKSALQTASLADVTVRKPQPIPQPVWRGEVGSTLKDTLFRWSASQSCLEGGSWRVIWETAVNYPIDAPLRFQGNFHTALNGLFGLYQHAQKPLYAFTNSTQCVIRVTDKG